MTESGTAFTAGLNRQQASASATAVKPGQGGPKKVRVRWNRSLDKILLSTATEANPRRRGFTKRLHSKWETQHLPSCSLSALAARLYKVRKHFRISPRDPEAGSDVGAVIASLENTESAMNTVTQEVSQSPKETPISKPQLPNEEEVLKALREELAEAAADEGDFSKRERLPIKVSSEEGLQERINEAAEATLRPEDTLWQLNCLLYAMSKTEIRLRRNPNIEEIPGLGKQGNVTVMNEQPNV